MILSHRALNMSSYRAIWTHFRPSSICFINLILQLLASGTCSRQIHDRFPIDPQYMHDRCIIIRCLWNPCDKDFRILDLLEPLRQRFQDFRPARTLATKIWESWTCWNPCVKDFRILDLLEPLRQRFPDFQTPPPAAPDEFSDPNLTPLPTHPGIKYVARSPCCDKP